MNWTVEQLLGEIAAILVRLENGRVEDAHFMAVVIVGGTMYHERARAEFAEEISLIEESSLASDELPEGVEAMCEVCGDPCEYDSELCLCTRCAIGLDEFDEQAEDFLTGKEYGL